VYFYSTWWWLAWFPPSTTSPLLDRPLDRFFPFDPLPLLTLEASTHTQQHNIMSSLPSPTPSSSNSDHTNAFIKRKPLHGLLHPKPPKINKPNNLDNLSFDPFNPHPGMSKEERKLARMIRNRTAAQASRDRKKEHVAELENRVRELEEQVKALSRPQSDSPPASCLRPCCRQQQPTATESSDKPAAPLSTAIPSSAHMDSLWSCRPISESIDPSIIELKPSSSSSSPAAEPSRSKSTPIIMAQNDHPITLDPQLQTERPHDGQQPDSALRPTGATISPTQAEYLSRVRIHVLEEENMQLKNQLEYELKKAHQFKSRLLSSRLTQPGHQPRGTMVDEQLPIDQGLMEMMLLKDEEIENLLLTSSGPAAPMAALQQQTQGSTPRMEHPEHMAQLSLDWDSLLLDEGETTTSWTTPRASLSSMDYEQPFGGTRRTVSQTQSVTEDWRIMEGFGTPDTSSMHGGHETQPETPPPDQQPQAPSDAQPAQRGPSAQSISHHRLVAREVKQQVSLQRNGWEMGLTGAVRSWEAGPSGVSGLCVPRWAQPIPLLLISWWTMVMGRGLTTACCLILCWVAWESLGEPRDVLGASGRSRASKTTHLRPASPSRRDTRSCWTLSARKSTRPTSSTTGASLVSPSSKTLHPALPLPLLLLLRRLLPTPPIPPDPTRLTCPLPLSIPPM